MFSSLLNLTSNYFHVFTENNQSAIKQNFQLKSMGNKRNPINNTNYVHCSWDVYGQYKKSKTINVTPIAAVQICRSY